MKDYILELESHMAETHRQASKLIKRQGELGLSLGEFGSSLMVLGKFEQSALADHFVNIGEKSQKLAKQSQVPSKAASDTTVQQETLVEILIFLIAAGMQAHIHLHLQAGTHPFCKPEEWTASTP